MESLATKSDMVHVRYGSCWKAVKQAGLLVASLLLLLLMSLWGQKNAAFSQVVQAATPKGSAPLTHPTPILQISARSEPSKTLVLIYAVGDNDLSEPMLRLLNDAERSAENPNLAIWMMLDGPGAEDSVLYQLQPDTDPTCPSYTDFSCAGRYSAGKNRWQWSEESARPESITQFITQALASSGDPAQLILALVGHGSGWSPPRQEKAQVQSSADPFPGTPGWWQPKYGGLLLDLTPQISSLSTSALGEALNPERLGRSIDLLYLDACSMSMFEVAYELRNDAHYLLASPNWGWAAFPYDQFLSADTIPSGDLDARAIAESWMSIEANKLISDHYPFTLALTDLTQMAQVRSATDHLVDALRQGLPANRDLLGTLASQSTRYDRDYDGIIDRWDSYVDLADFARRVDGGIEDSASQSAAQQLQEVLATAIVTQTIVGGTPWNFPDQVWDWPNASGMSIYLPLNLDDDEWQRKDYSANSLQSARDGTWDELLQSWWEADAPDGPPCADDCPPPAPIPPQDSAENDDLYSYSYHLFSDPLSAHVGEPTNLFLTLHRQGGKQTVEDIKVRFFLGYPYPNEVTGGGNLLGEGEIHFLNPRGSDQSTMIPWTPEAAGDYTICARIDPTKRVVEDNEANNVICRTLNVLSPNFDQIAPKVDDLVASDPRQQTEQQSVTITVHASDPELSQKAQVNGSGQNIASMAFVDTVFNPTTQTWIPRERSGWSPYVDAPAIFPLSSEPGLHYLQFWVQDAAGNISVTPGQIPVNYLPATARLARNQAYSFRYHLEAGEHLKVTVTPLAGDPDLYIWAPQTVTPQLWSSTEEAGIDKLERIAPETGEYQIEVYGFSESEYQLTVEISQTSFEPFDDLNRQSDNNKPTPLPSIPLGSAPGLTVFAPRPAPSPIDLKTNFSIFLPGLQK